MPFTMPLMLKEPSAKLCSFNNLMDMITLFDYLTLLKQKTIKTFTQSLTLWKLISMLSLELVYSKKYTKSTLYTNSSKHLNTCIQVNLSTEISNQVISYLTLNAMLKLLILDSLVLLIALKMQEIQILQNTSLQDGTVLLKFYLVLQNIPKQLTCGLLAVFQVSSSMENQYFQETQL